MSELTKVEKNALRSAAWEAQREIKRFSEELEQKFSMLRRTQESYDATKEALASAQARYEVLKKYV